MLGSPSLSLHAVLVLSSRDAEFQDKDANATGNQSTDRTLTNQETTGIDGDAIVGRGGNYGDGIDASPTLGGIDHQRHAAVLPIAPPPPPPPPKKPLQQLVASIVRNQLREDNVCAIQVICNTRRPAKPFLPPNHIVFYRM